MFQARRRRESGEGNTNGHEDILAKAKKRTYRCMNELDKSEDDADDDDKEQQERSFVNQTTRMIVECSKCSRCFSFECTLLRTTLLHLRGQGRSLTIYLIKVLGVP